MCCDAFNDLIIASHLGDFEIFAIVNESIMNVSIYNTVSAFCVILHSRFWQLDWLHLRGVFLFIFFNVNNFLKSLLNLK